MALAGALRVFGLRCHVWFLLCLFGAVARRDFGPQLTKRFLNFLARCIGHGRNWASLIRRQLSGGHDDALDVRARLGENALHVKFFAHGSSYASGRPFHIIADARAAFERLVKRSIEAAREASIMCSQDEVTCGGDDDRTVIVAIVR